MSQTAAPSGGAQESRPSRPLLTFLTVLSGVTDEFERARLTATGLSSLLPCSVSGLALLDRSEASWNLVIQKAAKPVGATETKQILAELEPFFQEALRRPPVLIVTSGGETTDGGIPPSIEGLEVQHLAMAPLMTLRSRLGVLFAGWEERERCSPEDEMILLTLAEHSAISIENTRFQERLKHYSEKLEDLVEERTENLRQSEQRQRALLEIGNAIIAHLDKQSLFNAIAHALEKVVDFDVAALALLDPVRDVVKVHALAVTSPRKPFAPVGTEFPRLGSHLQNALDQKRPFTRRDLRTGPLVGLEERMLKDGIRSYIAVPLIVEGKAIGTLNLASRSPNRYSEDNAAFLVEMGKQIVLAVENMLAYEEIVQLKAQLEQENVYLKEEMKLQHGFEEIVGQCPAIKKVLKAIESVAPTDATVLLTGETGTGKELFALATHNLSPRKSKFLVKVNCAALPAGLIESELFGHEKGAFTGALSRKFGRFELAHGGTIFLDEIGDLPLELQAKLLRVLQEGEFERVGGSQTIKVDVRVIAATNREMDKAIKDGKFRDDLYYRLSVFPIDIPPLRERTEDIPALVSLVLRLHDDYPKKFCQQPNMGAWRTC